jgi:AraC-like DNA-binding protein
MLLSRNYPPSPALAPFVARHYVFSADLPADFEMVDRLLSETAFVRVLLQGDWAAEMAPGDWQYIGPVVFSGASSRPQTVRVRGPFQVVGIAFRPCGWTALFDRPASDFADRIVHFSDVWGGAADDLLNAVSRRDDDRAILSAAEAVVTARLDAIGRRHVDTSMRLFERIARNDSTMQVQQVAAKLQLTTRKLERHCLASFGHSPKMVLRRSRFLDMATVMRGLGDPSDEELAELRYFDQSHRTREFRRFIGMTPSQFTRTPTPLLNAGLELRHERKAEAPED